MKNWRWLWLSVAAFLLDRLSKSWAAGDLLQRRGGEMPLIDGVIQFCYAENEGMAFSLLWGNAGILIGFSGLMMLVLLLILLFAKQMPRLMLASLALMLGGGIGNLYDRILYGRVIDFLMLQFVEFAIFNVADVFVCCGAVLFVLQMIIQEKRGRDMGA